MSTGVRASKNKKIVKEMNKINTNEMILILNPNSQGGNTGKNWVSIYSKVKEFLPKIIELFLQRKQMMAYLIHASYFEKVTKILLLLEEMVQLMKLQMDFLIFNHKTEISKIW